MDFINELRWRGMLQDQTPGVEKALANHKMTGYIGFDPTAPSLTIGNYVQIMLLTLFQKSGHTPIALMGGATGRIGDPSGKDKERELLDYEALDRNLEHQTNQIKKFLDFDKGPNAAILVDNIDFYGDMNVLTFLRDVGKTLTVNYMMSKESVKQRLDSGISYTEFSYQLLQAYDFQRLYEDYNCTLQMGGSDQWGNITSGTEFIRRNLGADANVHALTTPLLTKADGSKFGKSVEGNIWLDPEMTSPYKFYQFWINADDRDIHKFIRYFTLKSREEIESLEKEYEDDPRKLKEVLAEEVTERVHSREDVENVQKVSRLLFYRKAGPDMLHDLDKKALKMVADEIPSFDIPRSALDGGLNIIELLSENTTIAQSKGEARRSIKGNAISVNKVKITSHEATVDKEDLLYDSYIMVESGKKNKYMLRIV